MVLEDLGPTDVTSDAMADVNREEGLAVTVPSWLVDDINMEVLIELDWLGTTDVDAFKLEELDKPPN